MAKPAGFKEFVALMALSMSLVALAIDAMLPALFEIADELEVVKQNSRQLVLTVLFLGLAVGQIFYGPISDSTGRRAPIFVGFVLFLLGTVVAARAQSFEILLMGRFLQGLGAAGPRIITVAIIRDHAAGREMARIMSLVMMVFILVPAIAPALGQLVLLVSDWRMIFYALMGLSIATSIWFYFRQPETLLSESRRPFSISALYVACIEIMTNRVAVVYTIASGLIFGAFVGFLNSSQQLLQELYGLGSKFPAYFAILALTIGIASWGNSRLVVQFGMRLLCRKALWTVVVLSSLFFLRCVFGVPPLWLLMAYLVVTFFATGILFGNLNALAMEPLGHIAGLASSVIGSATTLISLSLGYVIGNLFNNTPLPVVSGFALLSFLSLLLMQCDRSPLHAP